MMSLTRSSRASIRPVNGFDDHLRSSAFKADGDVVAIAGDGADLPFQADRVSLTR